MEFQEQEEILEGLLAAITTEEQEHFEWVEEQVSQIGVSVSQVGEAMEQLSKGAEGRASGSGRGAMETTEGWAQDSVQVAGPSRAERRVSGEWQGTGEVEGVKMTELGDISTPVRPLMNR